MHIEQIYISLIVRYLKNEISDSEKTELFHWVYFNNENEKFFYHIKDIWETAQYESVVKGADTENEWERLALAVIHEESEHFQEKKSTIRKLYKSIQVAAIIIITFGIGFFVQKYLPNETTYASVNVPYGAKSKIKLPDGSKIWVNSGSTIQYPNNFNNKEVDLYLEGEAFFDIKKNSKRTVIVNTSTIKIRVHGTCFNVKSYNDEDIVETTLLEGSISITGKVGDKVIKDPIFLEPNEQATLTKSRNNLQVNLQKALKQEEEIVGIAPKIRNIVPSIEPKLRIVEGIEVESYMSWKNNILTFKNERFEDLARKMERWYDVNIVIYDNELKNSRYTGTFEKESIDQAIEALSISLPFTYKIEKNQIKIIKKK